MKLIRNAILLLIMMFPQPLQEVQHLDSLSLYEIITGGSVETIGKEATIARVIDLFEGGFVNNPNDPGGATNMGITLATYRSVKPDATVNDIKHLSKQAAINMYLQLYWNKFDIDEFPVDVQDVVFDSYVQYSPHTANILIQKALNSLHKNISVDGIVGEDTFLAVKSVNAKALRTAILDQRRKYYENLATAHPEKEQFLDGWLNRLDSLS